GDTHDRFPGSLVGELGSSCRGAIVRRPPRAEPRGERGRGDLKPDAPSRAHCHQPRSDTVVDPFRPNIGKIVVFFVVVVAAMMLPIAGGIGLAFSGPPPYLLREDGFGPEWATAAPHDFPDGSSVTVSTHPDEAAAREGADAVLKAVPRSCTE